MDKNIIKSKINLCKIFVKTLDTKVYFYHEIVNWFTELCQHLASIINLIAKLTKDGAEKMQNGQKETLLLYLTQLLTALSLLINVFVKENDIQKLLSEARSCALKQVNCCLEGIEDTIFSKDILMDPSGSFIKWMDASLDKISEIDINYGKEETLKTCNEAKVLFEEVLSHAMSIAQVALSEDCKIIKGGSQMVLDSLSSLIKEIEKTTPNSAMVNLFVDSCSDKLCSLERKVNMAVLKLSLAVFSEYTKSLKLISDFCLDVNNRIKMEELDALVVDFDLHVDRVMQIGFFAVSCSTCASRAIKIRSCLASIEALECELVPAFTSALMDNTNLNLNYAAVLKNHWLQQAKILQQTIFLIIDPFAFCQVIFEESKSTVDLLTEKIKVNNQVLSNSMVQPLINNAMVLKAFLNVINKEVDNIDRKNIEIILHDFKNVLHELKSACNILLDNDKTSIDGSLRVLKRCKIVSSLSKKLWYCFAKDIETEKENSLEMHCQKSKEENLQKNKFLDHLVNRGKEILKDRSILYKHSFQYDPMDIRSSTIKKMSALKGLEKPVPLSKLVHLRKLSFMNSKTESMDLQITDILNNLTDMSNSFNTK